MFNTFSVPQIPQKNGFHFIRLACCLVVIIFHAAGFAEVGLSFRFFDGRDAVCVFFILSGFFVTASYLRSKSLAEYACKRFRKIFPLYWAVVVFFAIALCVTGTLSAREYFSSFGFWKYLAANLLTLNFLHPNLPGVFNGNPVNGALWTIKIEVAFYVTLPLVLALISWRQIKYNKHGGGYLFFPFAMFFPRCIASPLTA